MSDLTIALAGGAIGSVATAGLSQSGRALAAWAEIDLHDAEAFERNSQLVIWVDDRTRILLAQMDGISNGLASRGLQYSGQHGGALAEAKAAALHEYRDEESRAMIDLARLRADEGGWHRVWRRARRRPAPALTVSSAVMPFLDRWREPVTRHLSTPSGNGAPVLDRTRRAVSDALGELPSLKLT